MSKSNTNKTGRSKRHAGAFFMLDHDLMKCPAWLGLSAQARAVLFQVGFRYNGRNNGTLAASLRDMEAECRINKDTAKRALDELCAAGFLDRVQPGSFARKVRHAAEYRLTWRRCDKTGLPPSRAFKHRRERQKGQVGSSHEAAWQAGS